MSADQSPGDSSTRSRIRSAAHDIVHTLDDETADHDRDEIPYEAARPKRPRFFDPFRLLAAAATGSAMWLSAPNYDLWWLAFVGWVPLLWAIHNRPRRHAFFYGWISGFVSVFIGFFWMSELLTRFAGFGTLVAAAITAIFGLSLGLMWAIPAWLTALLVERIGDRSGHPTLFVFPMAWAFTEFLLSTVSIFPVHMALSWAWQPLWIQTAELGGAVTVSFVMVAINAALWELLRGWLERKQLDKKAAAVAAAWLVGVPAYGWIRLEQVETQMAEAPKLDVGVAQGNFGIKTYASPGMKSVILRELQQVTANLQREGADVVLWGETAYPYTRFSRQHETDLPERDPRRIQKGFTVPVIVGLVTRDATGANPYAWNTAWVLDADGRWGDRYDKNYPLTFGEAAPPGIDPEWYLDKIPSASHLNRGDGPAAIEAAGYRFGALICYEDILGAFTREVANERVNALVNLTNDSWFGKTREQSEHLGLAVFRAVEHRKPLLRSVNAGISAYVDPTGRVVEQTEVTDSDEDGFDGAEGFVVEVPMMPADQRTLYGITGSLFGWLCGLGLLGIWGWTRYHQRRESEHGPGRAAA